MASLDLYPTRSAEAELIPVPFELQLDDDNDAEVLRGSRVIESAVHTSEGIYTLTLREGWYAGIVTGLTLTFAGASVELFPNAKSCDPTVEGDQEVVVRTVGNDGAVDDPPAVGANSTRLSGVLWLSNLPPPEG